VETEDLAIVGGRGATGRCVLLGVLSCVPFIWAVILAGSNQLGVVAGSWRSGERIPSILIGATVVGAISVALFIWFVLISTFAIGRRISHAG